MRQKFLLLLLATMFFTACSDNGGVTPPTPYGANDFFNEFGASARQTFSINPSVGSTLVLDGGTVVTIPPGAFTIGGQPISGNITFEVIEVLKRSDIIFSGTNTNYKDGKPLLSDGFFHFSAKQGNTPVDKYLKENMQIELIRKDYTRGWTQLWEGFVDDGQFAWDDFPADAVVGDSANAAGQEFGFVFGGENCENNNCYPNFIFNLGKLGWFNCDIYWNNGVNTTVIVNLTGTFGELATYQGYSGDTYVYFCGKGDNVIAQLYTPNGPGSVKSYDNSMPVGKIGKLIAFSIKDNKFFFASKNNVTITANLIETLDLQPSTKAAIQAEIEALDNFN